MTPQHVHWLAGGLIAAFAAVLLAREAGKLQGRWPQLILPLSAVCFGLFLILDPILFHGGSFGAEGLQHQIQGALVVAAGVIEWFRTQHKLKGHLFAAVLPAVIVFIGIVFVLHAQQPDGDMSSQLAQHRILGVSVIATGIVKAADSLRLARGNWASVGWLLFLLLVSAQLFLYSPGAATMSH